jgi:hypothetical protein
MPATQHSTLITIASEINGVHALQDNSVYNFKFPFHGLHLTFTRSADTVVIQQLRDSTVVVEIPGQIDGILTRNKSFTINENASVCYYCKDRDDGSLYVDREDVIMVHYGPFSFNEFADYLASKGMTTNVACCISTGLGFAKKTQLRFVTEQVIQDIKEDCFDALKVSDEDLDLLRKICQEHKEEQKGAK